MSKEDIFVLICIVTMIFSIGEILDRHFFFKDRFIDGLIKKCKKEGKCLICERPMEITDDNYDQA